jgi:FkbM family methyltransferase
MFPVPERNIQSFVDKHSGFTFFNIASPCSDDMNRNGIYEYDLITWCKQFLTKDQVFVDIGAHMGTYSFLLHDACKKVVSFEPQPLLFECFQKGLEANSITNVTVHNCALGNEEEKEIEMYTDSKWIDGGGTSCVKPKDIGNFFSSKVSIKKLDSFLIQDIGLIKIDVEGFEFFVLKGGEDTLHQNKYPPILFECNTLEAYDVIHDYLSFLGYLAFKKLNHCMYFACNHPNFQKKCGPTELHALEKIPDSDNWEVYLKRAVEFRIASEYKKAYKCLELGVKLNPPKKALVDFAFESSIVYFYLNKLQKGHAFSEQVVLSPLVPYAVKTNTLYNQQFYLQKVPFHEIRLLKPPNILSPHTFPSTPAIVAYKNGFLYNHRCVNYKINETGKYIVEHSDIITINIVRYYNENFQIEWEKEVKDVSSIPKVNKTRILGTEDIRFISSNCISAVRADIDPTWISVIYSDFDPKNASINSCFRLKVGNGARVEKNWIPFFKEETIHFIYKIDPLEVYKMDMDTKELTKVNDHPRFLNLDPGITLEDFRGSSSAIPYKEGYLFTVHTVFLNPNNVRVYYHRFCWVNKEFTHIKYSKHVYFEKIGIEYNVSLCHSKYGLFIPFSVNDSNPKLGVLEYKELDKLLGL